MKRIAYLLALLCILLTVAPTPSALSQESGENLVYLPLVLKNTQDPAKFRTGIDNIAALMETCPQNDPAYAQITADFTLRLNGNEIAYNSIPCSEPVSAMTIERYSSPLITLQALRIIYHMDTGQPNQLSWTDKTLYQWLKGQVAGVNLKTAPGQLYCCDNIGGRRYISQSLQDEADREWKRSWDGMSSTLAYLAHEARHATPPYYSHVTGCPAFPNPTDPYGCDQTYDPNDPGAYGVQYWLEEAWLLGKFNIGLSCAADGGFIAASTHLFSANSFRDRFVTNAPPELTLPAPPLGGPCYAP